jgi:hypothetical protein
MLPQLTQPFINYSIKHEGFTPFMYCDVLNLVTTGIGNLIDMGPNHNQKGMATADVARLNTEVSPAAMAPAMGLPWKHKGSGWSSKNPVVGAPLSQSEIAAAWTATKQANSVNGGKTGKGLSQDGGFSYAGLTDATLDMQAISDLVSRTMASFNKTLVSHYPDFDKWPADAQFAVMSFSWANGPAFQTKFPQFNAALLAQDWDTCITQGQFRGGGSVTDPASRNHDNAIMFKNASDVAKGGGDRTSLIFPGSGGISPLVGPLKTQPVVPGPLITSTVTGTEIAVGATLAAGAAWGIWKWWGRRS